MKRENWVAMLPFYLLSMIVFIGIATAGSKTITVVRENEPVLREHVLVIDAGHGGVDGGATSCTGVLESTINLQFALRLNDLFHFLGYETKMIRTTDTSIYTQGESIAAKKVSDLKERVRIVNETNGAILISLHQNTFPSSIYEGPQVFYGSHSESRELATTLQTALNQTLLPTSKRQSKQAKGVYLMEQIEKNGVLVECGFLTNPQEESRLRDGAYQQKFCAIIASVISRFIDT